MAVFDTNIIIDHLLGVPEAQRELAVQIKPSISIITWMEVMAGTDEGDRAMTRTFLDEDCEVIPLDPVIALQAVNFRQERRLKLLDAIILATAYVRRTHLVTRDTLAFSAKDPLIRIPY